MKIHEYVNDLSIHVNDSMQKNYKYKLSEKYGDNIHHDMKDIAISPAVMLSMGVFSGKYLNDCQEEFPEEWFENSKKTRRTEKDTLHPTSYDKTHNYFGVRSGLSLKEWKRKNWIIKPDTRGWFQWWCRYYIGRRIPDVDEKQIKRWKSYKRHVAQVLKNAVKENRQRDESFRPTQRQSLLQWAHNPFPEDITMLGKM